MHVYPYLLKRSEYPMSCREASTCVNRINGKVIVNNRQPKIGELSKKLNSINIQLDLLKNNKLAHIPMMDIFGYEKAKEKEIDFLMEKKRKIEKQLKNHTSLIKSTKKNIKPEKLKEMVMDFINNSEESHVTKEELAKLFNVKENAIENVFRELNRQGILSQRRAHYCHDTSRNPFCGGSESGWASDIYYIKNK